MNNKRGISAVVATVLIILITVAAVTIIWAAIIPMIKEQTVGGTTCLDAVSQVGIESEGGYTCFEFDPNAKDVNPEGNVSIQLSRGAADFELSKVQIIISEAGSTTSVPYDLTSSPLNANEEKVLLVNYVNTTTAGPNKVEIAPIVKIGNTEKTCDVAGSAALSVC